MITRIVKGRAPRWARRSQDIQVVPKESPVSLSAKSEKYARYKEKSKDDFVLTIYVGKITPTTILGCLKIVGHEISNNLYDVADMFETREIDRDDIINAICKDGTINTFNSVVKILSFVENVIAFNNVLKRRIADNHITWVMAKLMRIMSEVIAHDDLIKWPGEGTPSGLTSLTYLAIMRALTGNCIWNVMNDLEI